MHANYWGSWLDNIHMALLPHIVDANGACVICKLCSIATARVSNTRAAGGMRSSHRISCVFIVRHKAPKCKALPSVACRNVMRHHGRWGVTCRIGLLRLARQLHPSVEVCVSTIWGRVLRRSIATGFIQPHHHTTCMHAITSSLSA